MTSSKKIIGNMLQDRRRADDRDYSHLHPSEMGGCPRKLFFQTISIEGSDDYKDSTLMIFDNGHSMHSRVQKYFRDAGLMLTDKIVDIKNEYSSVSFRFENDQKIYNKKQIVYGASGRKYPFNNHDSVYLKSENSDKKMKISELNIGDEFYLSEVPFEMPDIHLCGHIDGIVFENDVPTILEIKSINTKGFTRLFYNSELKEQYVSDMSDEKICHACGSRLQFGESMAAHLMEDHYELAIPQKKHVIQANAYMDAVNVGQTLFWYENKDNQIICDILSYKDQLLVDSIHSSCHKLWEMIEDTNRGNLRIPAKPGWAKRSDCFGCYYCEYNNICWDRTSNIFDAVATMLDSESE